MPELDWTIPEWLQRELLGNPIWRWLLALPAAVAVWAALSFVRFLLRRRGTRQAEEESEGKGPERWHQRMDAPFQRWTLRPSDVLQALGRTSSWFLLAVALYAGSFLLDMDERRRDLVEAAATVALVIQGGLFVTRLAMVSLERVVTDRRERDPASVTGFTALGVLLRGAVWVLVVLLVLANLGVEITGLVAGLGIGGIAIALAVQNILGDLFASLTIVLDKPFEVGDFIIVGDLLGTVEKVGLKTTRVRSLSGEQLVFSNNDLLGSRIRNYKRMWERRVVFSFGVVYQTTAEQLERIPGIVREIVQGIERTRFDRAHFKAFGASSLDFEVVFYMLVPDYNAMMDVQQAVNLALVRRFEAEGIDFAYPTQTIYLRHEGEPAPAPA